VKKDIILSGVGGQGILSIAAVIGLAAVKEDLFIKQSEVHGMSQQGGEVYSHLRLSSNPIWSDLIPEGIADMILAVEPLEALRYVNYLNPEGWLITSTEPLINIPDYPGPLSITSAITGIQNHILVDAVKTARDAGTTKAANMVMLGAASPFLDIREDSLINAIQKRFTGKGEAIVEINTEAFRAGRNIAIQKK